MSKCWSQNSSSQVGWRKANLEKMFRLITLMNTLDITEIKAGANFVGKFKLVANTFVHANRKSMVLQLRM